MSAVEMQAQQAIDPAKWELIKMCPKEVCNYKLNGMAIQKYLHWKLGVYQTPAGHSLANDGTSSFKDVLT